MVNLDERRLSNFLSLINEQRTEPMLTASERENLKQYYDGNVVEDKDRAFIHRLSSIGLVKLGFTVKDDSPQETAKLTERGRAVFNMNQVNVRPSARAFRAAVDILTS